MRIVVVEDEIKIMQGLVALINKNTNHTVVGEGKNGIDGIELVKRFKPDLVITDIKMPDMDGIEMITMLKEMGEKHKTIILSGFSDFSYAQQAIKLGVSEYLLKPITAEDIQNSLNIIEQLFELEQQRQTSSVTIEELFRNIVLSSSDNEGQVLNDINKLCGADQSTQFTMFMAYLGGSSEHYKLSIIQHIERFIEVYMNGTVFYIVRVDAKMELIVLIQGDFETSMLNEIFNRHVVTDRNDRYHEQSIWATMTFSGISAYKESVLLLRKQFKWSIVLGTKHLIVFPVEAHTVTHSFQYPFEIEGKIKKAICNENSEWTQKYAKDFLETIQFKIYDPDVVISAFVQFISALFLIIQELDTSLYEHLGHQKSLKQIMEAVTYDELYGVYQNLFKKILLYQGKNDTVSNYTIKRAINFIKNHYQEGITLEETAMSIEITPEYLSTLFNREVGTNFNLFIKEFRISKAKKLLMGSEMKIYEIAQAVGYSDSKYFCRVFKEIIGLSPSDYRITNK